MPRPLLHRASILVLALLEASAFLSLGPSRARAEGDATPADGSSSLASELPWSRMENVVYAPDVHGAALVMDIFRPTGASNGLGVVVVVSGAWYSDQGKLRDLMRAGFADVFCERGYTIFAARPGSITRFTGNEMLSSVKRAVRWVRLHAAQFAVDPERLGITGASAGGHLSSLAALTADEGSPEAKEPIDRLSSHVKAVGVFFPPTDFPNWMGGMALKLPATRGLFVAPGAEPPSEEDGQAALRAMSPAHRVHEDAPPFLLIHGDKDTLVPLKQSELLVAALEEKGVPVELIVKPGGGHAWPTIREEIVKLADWFDARLKE